MMMMIMIMMMMMMMIIIIIIIPGKEKETFRRCCKTVGLYTVVSDCLSFF